MAGSGGAALELDAVYVRVYADFTELQKAQSDIAQMAEKISQSLHNAMASFDTLGLKARNAVGEMLNLFNTMGDLTSGMTLATVSTAPGAVHPFERFALDMAESAAQIHASLGVIQESFQNFRNAAAIPIPYGAFLKFTNDIQAFEKVIIASIGEITFWIGELRAELGLMLPTMGGLQGVLGDIQNLEQALTRLAAEDLRPITSSLRSLSAAITRLAAADMKALEAKLDELEGILTSFVAAVQAAAAELQSLSNSFANLSRNLVKFTAVDMKGVDAQVKAFVATLTQLTARATTAIPILNTLAASMTNLATAATALAAASKAVSGGGPGGPAAIATTATQIGTATRNATAGMVELNRQTYELARGASRVVPELTALRFGLTALGGLGVYTFAKFDDAISHTVARITELNRGVKDFPSAAQLRAGITRGIEELAAKSTTSMVDLAKGYEILAAAGVHSMKALEIAETFAVASGQKMEVATKNLIGISDAWGLSMGTPEERLKNLTRLGDLFVHMATQAGVSEEKLANSMGGRFVQAAKMANLSLEDSVALLATLSKATPRLQHEEVGTLAAYGILELTSAMQTHRRQWEDMGIAIYDAQGQMRPMLQIMDDLTAKMGAAGNEASRAREIVAGFGNRALSALLPLMESKSRLVDFQEEVKRAGGAMQIMAEAMRSDFMGQLRMLWNNITVLAEAIGKQLAPVIGVLIEGIKQLTAWFTSLNPAMQNLIVITTLLTLAFRPLVALVTYFVGLLIVTPIMAFVNALSMLASVLFFIATFNPIVMLFRGLLAVVNLMLAPFRLLIGLAQSLWSYFMSSLSAIKSFFVGVWDVITMLWKGLVTTIGIIYQVGYAIVSAWVHALIWVEEAAVSVAKALYKAAVATYTWLTTITGSFISAVWDGIKFIGSAIVGAVKTVALGAWQMVTSALMAIATLVIDLLVFFAGLVAMAVLLVPLLALIASIGTTVALGFVALGRMLGGAVDNAAKAWKDNANNIRDNLKDLGDKAGKVWDGAADKARGWAQSAGGFINTVAGFFWNFAHNMEVIFKWISDNWESILTDMGQMGIVFVNNMLTNLQAMGVFILKLGLEAWQAFWEPMITYGAAALEWLQTNWKNIMYNIGVLFKSFWDAMLANFGVFMDILKLQFLKLHPLATEAQKKGLDAQIAALTATLKTPFEDLNANSFKAMQGTEKIFGDASEKVKNSMLEIGDSINAAYIKLQGMLKSPLEGFEAITPGITGLLFEGGDKMIEKLKEMFLKASKMLSGEGEGGPIRGGYTFGGSFKQISEARYILGGHAAETLEYQQLETLKRINGNVEKLVDAANKQANKPPAPEPINKPMPPIVREFPFTW